MRYSKIAGPTVVALWVISSVLGFSQQPATFSEAVRAVMNKPEFRHANFGLELFSLDSQSAIFSLNADKYFTPGSTTKLLTEGTALQLLGADYRFHTLVYRTGEIDKHGTLKGDLILVASGDPNLSSRIQSDGALAFRDEDHSYGGLDAEVVPGDALAPLHDLAAQIAAAGIHKIDGHVLVDATLFTAGGRELGTGVYISPISVNDNVIDLMITPGESVGTPAKVDVSPSVPYLAITNKLITGVARSKPSIEDHDIDEQPNSSRSVELTGSIPLGSRPYLEPYAVKDPVNFAEALLQQALIDKGVQLGTPKSSGPLSFANLKKFYDPKYKVAEHVSPPLSEEIKVTLKVSQNLHASMTPYILGAVLGHTPTHADFAGFQLERGFLEKAGLDLGGASQADGAGGAQSAFYTPDFMAHYLAFMAAQSTYHLFQDALPVLGRDGTLVKTEANTPAAGQVFAKTGTFGAMDLLNHRLLLVGKGLAGYMTTTSGQHLAFAMYVNHVSLPADPDAAQQVAGAALGAIAAAAYSLPIDKPSLDAQ